METGAWTWLEIAKLTVGIITPLTVAFLGILIHRATKRFEHAQWRNQKLIEKRLAIYDLLAPELNDLYCYFTYVGGWRDLDPPTVVALKRTVDKKIYLAAPLFSQEFFLAGMAFQDQCFETFNGWGTDARLKTKFQRRKEARRTDWRDEWDACFSDKISELDDIKSTYKQLMAAFARDIEVHDFNMALPERNSTNIR
ncbi:MAG TPA: hypothetical protein VIF34_15680 [Methylocystis sp.]|jgi:hypothetical protein